MDKKPQDEASGDVIQRPEPAHSIERYDTESDDDELEATELREISEESERMPRLSHVISPQKPMIRWYDPVKKFWRHNVRISVPHDDCRDHLGESLGCVRLCAAHLQSEVTASRNEALCEAWHGFLDIELYRRTQSILTAL